MSSVRLQLIGLTGPSGVPAARHATKEPTSGREHAIIIAIQMSSVQANQLKLELASYSHAHDSKIGPSGPAALSPAVLEAKTDIGHAWVEMSVILDAKVLSRKQRTALKSTAPVDPIHTHWRELKR